MQVVVQVTRLVDVPTRDAITRVITAWQWWQHMEVFRQLELVVRKGKDMTKTEDNQIKDDIKESLTQWPVIAVYIYA